MPDKAHLHALMTEIGPALELVEVTEFDEDNLWVLVVRDDVVVFVDYVPEDRRLRLTAEIGVPSPADRLQLYELMLQYNARWKETGGVRLVLDGPEGGVVQAYDLPVAGLDLHRLQNVIRNFGDMLEGWRKIVATGAGAPQPIGPGGVHATMTGGMIRG